MVSEVLSGGKECDANIIVSHTDNYGAHTIEGLFLNNQAFSKFFAIQVVISQDSEKFFVIGLDQAELFMERMFREADAHENKNPEDIPESYAVPLLEPRQHTFLNNVFRDVTGRTFRYPLEERVVDDPLLWLLKEGYIDGVLYKELSIFIAYTTDFSLQKPTDDLRVHYQNELQIGGISDIRNRNDIRNGNIVGLLGRTLTPLHRNGVCFISKPHTDIEEKKHLEGIFINKTNNIIEPITAVELDVSKAGIRLSLISSKRGQELASYIRDLGANNQSGDVFSEKPARYSNPNATIMIIDPTHKSLSNRDLGGCKYTVGIYDAGNSEKHAIYAGNVPQYYHSLEKIGEILECIVKKVTSRAP